MPNRTSFSPQHQLPHAHSSHPLHPPPRIPPSPSPPPSIPPALTVANPSTSPPHAVNTTVAAIQSPSVAPPSNGPARYRLHLYISSSGRYLEAFVGSSDSIDAVKESIVSLTNIPSEDQIFLLKDGTELEGRYTVGHYWTTVSTNVNEGSLASTQVDSNFVPPSSSSSSSPSSPTATTKNSSTGLQIFIFQRSEANRRPSVQPPQLPIFEVQFSSEMDFISTCPNRDYILTHARKNIMMQTLPQFERSFMKHIVDGKSYLNAFSRVSHYGRNSYSECASMLESLAAALNHLQIQARHIRNATEAFQTRYGTTKKKHHQLLQSWTKDIEQLKEIEIVDKMRKYVGQIPLATTSHTNSPSSTPSNASSSTAAPSSSSSSSKLTLYDVFRPSLPRLQNDHEQCRRDQTILDRKVDEMITKSNLHQARANELLQLGRHELNKSSSNTITGTSSAPTPIEQLARLKEMIDREDEQVKSKLHTGLKQLEEDYDELNLYIDKLESSLRHRNAQPPTPTSDSSQLLQFDTSIPYQPSEAATRFAQRDGEHEELMNKFAQRWRVMKEELVPQIQQTCSNVHAFYHDLYSRIVGILPYLTNIAHVLSLQSTALDRIASQFRASFESLHHLPDVWSALAHEIPRRRMFRQLFHQEATAMAQRLHALAGDEIQRRHKWHQEYGQYVMKGSTMTVTNSSGTGPTKSYTWHSGFGPLVAQLNEKPPMIDMSFTDFDAHLPDLGETLPSTATGSATSTNPAIAPQFPWLTQLADLQERIRSLENELRATRIAPSISTASKAPSPGGRRASIQSSSTPATSTTATTTTTTNTIVAGPASPRLSSYASSTSPSSSTRELKARYEEKVAQLKELQKNTVSLELKLQQEQENHLDMCHHSSAITLKFDTAQKEWQLERKAHEQTVKQLRDELAATKETLAQQQQRYSHENDNFETLLHYSARKLAISNFAVSDMVIIWKNPLTVNRIRSAKSKPAIAAASSSSSSSSSASAPAPASSSIAITSPLDDGIDYLEVYAASSSSSSSHYFLSPETIASCRQLLKDHQIARDQLIAKQESNQLNQRQRQAVRQVEESKEESELQQSKDDNIDAASLPPASSSSSSSSSSSQSPFAVSPFVSPSFVGEIIELNRHTASSESNPFELELGTVYHIVTCMITTMTNQTEAENDNQP